LGFKLVDALIGLLPKKRFNRPNVPIWLWIMRVTRFRPASACSGGSK
jgi:hypothetical protein